MRNNEQYPWTPSAKSSLYGYTEASRNGAYSRAAWRKLREAYLSEHPLCVSCASYGKVVAATVVDHVTPIENEEDENFYNEDNLQSLCDRCHRQKTRKDNSRYSTGNLRKGNQLMEDLLS